jgi:hypothetical protein
MKNVPVRVATVAAFAVSIWSLAATERAVIRACGVSLAAVSLLALIVVGAALAAGYDAAGQCGRG